MSGLHFRRPLLIALLVVALGALPAVGVTAAPTAGTVDGTSFLSSLWQRLVDVATPPPAPREVRQPVRAGAGGAATDVPVLRSTPIERSTIRHATAEDGSRMEPDG